MSEHVALLTRSTDVVITSAVDDDQRCALWPRVPNTTSICRSTVRSTWLPRSDGPD